MSIFGDALTFLGGGLSDYEVETGEYTPSTGVVNLTINFAKTHDTTPFLVAMAMDSDTNLTDNNRNYVFVFFDYYRLFGGYTPGSPSSTTTKHYARAFYSYSGSSGTISNGGANCTHNSDESGSSSSAYSRYFVNESKFMPYTGSGSRYWGSGKKYKWIAFWKKST